MTMWWSWRGRSDTSRNPPPGLNLFLGDTPGEVWHGLGSVMRGFGHDDILRTPPSDPRLDADCGKALTGARNRSDKLQFDPRCAVLLLARGLGKRAPSPF
jgi:hypothetical protein